MKKILLIINDCHFSDRPPAWRVDTYRDDILVKLEECVTIAQQLMRHKEIVNGAASVEVIITGDVFHQKAASKVSHYLVQRVYEIISKFPCKVGILAGNHDLAAGRIDSIRKQPIGTILKNPNVFDMSSGGTWYDGLPGTYGYMDDSMWRNLNAFEAKNHILFCHMPIAPPGITYPYPYVSADADVFKKWQCVFYGHQHDSDGCYTHNKTMFVNYGSIARGSLTPKTLRTVPAVAVCEVIESKVVSVIPYVLKSVRPVKDVFRVVEYQERKAHDEDVDKFIDSLSTSEVSMLTIKGLMNLVSNMDIEEDVKVKATTILEEQQEC